MSRHQHKHCPLSPSIRSHVVHREAPGPRSWETWVLVPALWLPSLMAFICQGPTCFLCRMKISHGISISQRVVLWCTSVHERGFCDGAGLETGGARSTGTPLPHSWRFELPRGLTPAHSRYPEIHDEQYTSDTSWAPETFQAIPRNAPSITCK